MERQESAGGEDEDNDHGLPLAVVAHELRGPIAVVQTCAILLERWMRTLGPPPKEVETLLARLGRNLTLIERLASDLTDLGRAQLGPAHLQRTPTDLAALAADIVASFPADVRTRVRLDAPAAAPLVCDADRVGQVLANLVRNGLEHGAGLVDVRLRATPSGWTVTVENEGEIEPALRPRIFEPFVQGRGVRRGLGLGLHVVDRVVAAHGGTIKLTCEGRLVRFSVDLPAGRR